VPIIRYTCLVGAFLLGMLLLLGDRDTRTGSPAPDRWTAVDSLRALAHPGEFVQGPAFVRIERAPPEPASRTDLTEIAVPASPLIVNAQASMDLPKTASPSAAGKPRQRKIANRHVRVRTAIAQNAAPTSMEVFRPPSW
jgi:hypothetical protein